ncbi:MAG: NAD(P)H-dependent oxidoreductase [Rudaea sp.]
MNLLHIDSSALGTLSVSRSLSAEVVANLRKNNPELQVSYRDLAADPLPHWQPVVDASREPSTAGQIVLDQFLQSDIVVIGAPMYNFGIPSQLKAWIDTIAVPGKTFRYGKNGPEGLAGNRHIIVVSSRGGVYSEGAAAALDFQEKYLRAFFAFIGITDVAFVRAEGVGMDRAAAIAAARATMRGTLRKAA